MGTYEHTTTVATDPQSLFDYLTDVRNLPSYFDGMVAADPQGGGRVHVVAEVEGTRRESEAWLETDDAGFTMTWGSTGADDYRGELAVTRTDNGHSRLSVTLHTERTEGPDIHDGLQQTLANVKHVVEGSHTRPA